MGPFEALSMLNKLKPIMDNPQCKRYLEHRPNGVIFAGFEIHDSQLDSAVVKAIDQKIKEGGLWKKESANQGALIKRKWHHHLMNKFNKQSR